MYSRSSEEIVGCWEGELWAKRNQMQDHTTPRTPDFKQWQHYTYHVNTKHIQQRVTTYECNNEHNILEKLAILSSNGTFPPLNSI